MDASETMFLTREEITELTDRKQPRAQIRWLTERGYRFEIGASGCPKVLRSVIEARLRNTGDVRKSKDRQIRFDLINV